MTEVYRINFYVPETHVEAVKAAAFEAGGGTIGNYECCCWQVEGQGQFRPLEGSKPFIGTRGELEHVPEIKVEMICPTDRIKDVVAAIKSAHPYETPAYQYWKVNT
ncbi:MAG: NGG1p interacting factor NIF3 [Lentisphaerae bacterium GWF2_45_14]|nr:MAG: NGG1p interacting factor NIF3 [Lentisphaerae bacterium GWF2_45_14]